VTDGIDEELLRAFGTQMMRLSRRRSMTPPGSRLDASAFRILWLLVEGGPRTLRELAHDLQLERSTVNRQVNAALRHGLVERFAEPGSAGRRLRPTEAGLEAYRRDGAPRAAVFAEVLGELGARRARTLLQDLAAFNDAYDRVQARLESSAGGDLGELSP
jgi:DNA-binding MarR family transcriptional regulator